MKIKPGDIIFTRPNSSIFNFIRWWTKGDYGHVMLVTHVIGDHIFITEALSSGVDVNDFIWHSTKKEDYIVYRNTKVEKTLIEKLIKKTISYHGKPYDTLALLNFVIGRTCFGTDKAVYCSELIYRILKDVNMIEDKLKPEKTSPADLRRLMMSDFRYEIITTKYYK